MGIVLKAKFSMFTAVYSVTNNAAILCKHRGFLQLIHTLFTLVTIIFIVLQNSLKVAVKKLKVVEKFLYTGHKTSQTMAPALMTGSLLGFINTPMECQSGNVGGENGCMWLHLISL